MADRPGTEVMRPLMDGPVWCVGDMRVTDQSIEIRGWAIPPDGGHTGATFVLDTEEFDEIEYPLHEYPFDREEIERVFWYLPGAGQTGFACRTHRQRRELFSNGHATLKFVDCGTGRPFREEHNYYCCDSSQDDVDLPPPAHRRRVHGGDSESAFRLEGYSTYIKLHHLLQAVFGRSYDDFDDVLDWGCGCGRMTRYLRRHRSESIHGVDVDAANVQWCREHLDFGRFREIPLHPPTNLEGSRFDLLIGISVFTHLREEVQFEWLEELSRIASDDAVLLMSVHGAASACRSGVSADTIGEWLVSGYCDLGTNPDLGDSVEDQSYYRNALHTQEYIRNTWSRHFDIIEIIPGFIGNHQDLVIMKKKARSRLSTRNRIGRWYSRILESSRNV